METVFENGFNQKYDWNDNTIDIFDNDKTKEKKQSTRRKVECYELSNKYLYKRAHSETQLLDVLPKELVVGYTYNCITSGDVDALSYLKVILREQNLEHCLFSTWCMSAEDVLQIIEWQKEGRIKKLDSYLGEIFPNSYKVEYAMLKKHYDENPEIGRICVFKNHSKIFAGIGNKYAFGIQTSANINTNPRTENGSITIDNGIYNFYKEYYDGIISFV